MTTLSPRSSWKMVQGMLVLHSEAARQFASQYDPSDFGWRKECNRSTKLVALVNQMRESFIILPPNESEC